MTPAPPGGVTDVRPAPDVTDPAGPSDPVPPAAPDGAERDSVLDVMWRESDSALLVVDADRRIRSANPASSVVLTRYGLGVGDQIEPGVHAAVFAADGRTELPGNDIPLVRVLRGESLPRTTFVVQVAGTGVRRRILMSGRPVRLDDGAPGALLSWNDVTDAWEMAERNRAELDRLSRLLEGATEHAIIMLDAYGRVTTWSAAATRLHGYGQDEAVGMAYAQFFTEDDRVAGVPEQVLTRAVASGRAVTEGKRVRRDGSTFYAHATVTATRDEDGQLRGFVKVTQDVSGQRATERVVVQLNSELQEMNSTLERRVAERTAQLERQAAEMAAVNSELEAFSYSVSHDLRAPLRAMSGYARILEEEYAEGLGPEALRYVHRVQDNAVQMGNLIDALLSFSRLQRQSLVEQALDCRVLVQDCWESLTGARGERDVELVLHEMPPAMGDPRLIRQVWLNLLDNAIKYSSRRDDAVVEVSAVPQEDGTVWFRVHDNGVGFDMRYAPKLGQVFQRLHRPEDFAGTGIGLALVQRIVGRHGGRLTTQGELGAGATIGFTLRAAP